MVGLRTRRERGRTPASLLCDLYKLNHREQYPLNTEYIYSTLTPRSNKYFTRAERVVAFGYKPLVIKYLIHYFNDNFFDRPKSEVLNEYVRFIKHVFNVENPDFSHISDLHDLGYLPIKVKALKEGTLVPIKVPVMTIENTNPDFFWLTNSLETLISVETWQAMTSATIAYEYRKILDRFALKTVGNIDDVGFQAHDFSMRGMSSLESAQSSSAGHCTSFFGCETAPAVYYLEEYYNADIEKELVLTGIPATEHSVMSASTDADSRDEYDTFKRLINDVYPKGFVSIVSDTYDFWKVIDEILPRLKNDIMARDGKVVIRPDSGDPADIICGELMTEYRSLEDAEDYIYDQIREIANDSCEGSHNMGDDSYVVKYKVNDTYYKIKFSVDYNRHDKTYYYVDGMRKVSNEEFIPTSSELGLIESLWNIFGGTLSEKGYRVLDRHIGAIYGDSITLERAEEIVTRLAEKRFASTNIVLGVGSYSYQYNTRDTFGFAIKATHAVIDGEEKLLFKDPKTDDGTKRSQRGLVAVIEGENGIEYVDGLDYAGYEVYKDRDLLEVLFLDGELIRDESLSDIRDLLSNQLI